METLTNATPQAPPSDPPAQAPPKFYALFPSKGLGGVGGRGECSAPYGSNPLAAISRLC